ncbi:hypothetical protein M9H77_19403 [Catharanthus roseus]|uniref:Uncharacterized protein n=1 Tax=Catharanthus roseus TaxID=4058 RepID=A0ACC0BA95_CATRO|nr:hypothetical protein M9H77_19403 [Catharanthus roseus]
MKNYIVLVREAYPLIENLNYIAKTVLWIEEDRVIVLQLLAPDPSLKRFKSHKKSVWRLKKFGDVLTIVVLVCDFIFLSSCTYLVFIFEGCCYEIYVKAVMRQESRKQAKESV